LLAILLAFREGLKTILASPRWPPAWPGPTPSTGGPRGQSSPASC